MKFRKKPIVIDAIQFDGVNLTTMGNIERFVGKELEWFINSKINEYYCIMPTLEGDMKANLGDWIIKGVRGEFYPCKPDIFEQTYEKVDEQ